MKTNRLKFMKFCLFFMLYLFSISSMAATGNRSGFSHMTSNGGAVILASNAPTVSTPSDLSSFISSDNAMAIADNMTDLFNTPIESLTSVIKGDIGKTVIGLFLLLFITESLWMIVKTYLESHHDPLRTVLVKITTRVITGSFLLWIVTSSSNPKGGQNMLAGSIMSFFMGLASLITAGPMEVVSTSSTNDVGFNASDILFNLWGMWSDAADGLANIMLPTGGGFLSYFTDPMTQFFFKCFITGVIIYLFVIVFKISFNITLKICEFIIVVYAGVIMVAFVGSSWTKAYFDNYVKYIVNIAIDFFVILIILGYATTNINANAVDDSINVLYKVIYLIGTFMFFNALIQLAPKISAAMSSGQPNVSTGDSAAAMGAMATGGAAIAGKMGGGMAGGMAGAVAGAQGGSGIGGKIAGGISGMMKGASMGASKGAQLGHSLGSKIAEAGSSIAEGTHGTKKSNDAARSDKNLDMQSKQFATQQKHASSPQSKAEIGAKAHNVLSQMAKKGGASNEQAAKTAESKMNQHGIT